MKSTLILLLVNFISVTIFSQQQPVHWQFETKKVSDNTYEIYLSASIASPWHIYSQYTPTEGPSLPTSIKFSKNPVVEVIGNPQEKGKLITKHEELLDVNLKYFSGNVKFVQVVKVKGKVKTNLNGTIEYMACTDERCLPPFTVNFNIALN